ncbi:glycosyltransferase family 4 protein [Patescibacteria group bacterium]|nr:glycosyltransferase family 4 protein [Patescibacteria group bacterium]MBU0963442.1 glycosyltransferase family 4 protein [Patescibacteria group bacterium]
MRIALLTPTFSKFSGIDRVVENQFRKLTQEGNEVVVMTLEADINDEDIKVITIKSLRGQFLHRLYRLIFFLDFRKIKKSAEQLKDFNVIYSHQYPMNLIAMRAKKKYGIKFIYYNHGIASLKTFTSLIDKLYIQLIKSLSNWTVKKSDKVISISKYLRDVLKREIGIESEVVYNLVDKERFNSSISGLVVKKKYSLESTPVVLYVGRISPHKGIHLLIKSFNIVLDKIPNAKLLIVGKKTFNNYARKLETLAEKSVIFAGYVKDDELPFYYAACDVYATASLWEGFDLPIAEAQACGKPVVAYNLCSHPEIINKNGTLVKPKDINSFAKAIINTINKNEK